MQETFKRKPSNYRTYKLFLFIFFSIVFSANIFLSLYLLIHEDSFDLLSILVLGILIVVGLPLAIIVGRNQLRRKKSYIEMSETILTLTETHLIFKLNQIEQYVIPWVAIVSIRKDISLDRPRLQKYANRVGSIMIYCNEEYSNYIMNIKKDAYINDRNRALLVSVMYVDSDYHKLYDTIMDFYRIYGQNNTQ